MNRRVIQILYHFHSQSLPFKLTDWHLIRWLMRDWKLLHFFHIKLMGFLFHFFICYHSNEMPGRNCIWRRDNFCNSCWHYVTKWDRPYCSASLCWKQLLYLTPSPIHFTNEMIRLAGYLFSMRFKIAYLWFDVVRYSSLTRTSSTPFKKLLLTGMFFICALVSIMSFLLMHKLTKCIRLCDHLASHVPPQSHWPLTSVLVLHI